MPELIDPLPVQPSALPAGLAIQVIDACNLQCMMCAHKEVRRSSPRSAMTMKLFTRIIDEFLTLGRLNGVCLSLQCEPLLDKQLHERIQYIKKKRSQCKVYLSTNARLLSPNMYERLQGDGLDSLNISLNAVEEETFKAVCGSGYRQVMENTIHAVKNKPKGLYLTISSMLVENNIFELMTECHPVFKTIRALGIPWGKGPISNHCGSLSNYEQIVVFPEMQSSRKKLYCHDIFESAYVSSNGDLLGCCSDWRRKAVLGNLAKHDFFDIWQSHETAKRREQMLREDLLQLEPCRQCSQAWNIMRNRKKGSEESK
jgi:radical SAM protein with 4Fe4S-binding SPASM domain